MDVWRSSIVAHSLLRVPYETISLSLTFFVAGLGVYLGSACAWNLELNIVEGKSTGNIGVLGAFLAGALFSCTLFGYLLSKQDAENRRIVDTYGVP